MFRETKIIEGAPVILVEDERELAEEIRFELQSGGHPVQIFETAADGLKAARAGGVSVLVVDRMLNGEDGLTIVETLRGEGNATPVLVISALSSVDDRIMGLKAGGDDYLIKPFAIRELAARVEALLRRGGDPRLTRLQAGPLEMLALPGRRGRPFSSSWLRPHGLPFVGTSSARDETAASRVRHRRRSSTARRPRRSSSAPAALSSGYSVDRTGRRARRAAMASRSSRIPLFADGSWPRCPVDADDRTVAQQDLVQRQEGMPPDADRSRGSGPVRRGPQRRLGRCAADGVHHESTPVPPATPRALSLIVSVRGPRRLCRRHRVRPGACPALDATPSTRQPSARATPIAASPMPPSAQDQPVGLARHGPGPATRRGTCCSSA